MKQEKFTILIVDDEEIIRKMIIKFMEHFHDVQCYEAENGEQAIKIYKEKNINLVISDFNMPFMNGLELLHELITYDKEACVIIASANKDITLHDKAISEGAKKFIHKPFDIAELINSIKTIWKKYTDKLEEQ